MPTVTAATPPRHRLGTNPNAPRAKRGTINCEKPYPIRFAESSLIQIDQIQRHMMRHQEKPRQAVSLAQAVRLAIAHYALFLERSK
jgi:hypothetical protein